MSYLVQTSISILVMKPSKFSAKPHNSVFFRKRIFTMMVYLALVQATHATVKASDYGATGDGSTDDTDAIQMAIDAAQGDDVLVSAGTFRITRTLRITAATTMRGISQEATVFVPDTLATELILVSTNAAVHLSNFAIKSKSGQTGGAAITITAPTCNLRSEFSHISMEAPFIGFNFLRAAWWRIDSCYLHGLAWGVSVQNQNSCDEGDSTIVNSSFIGRAGATGVIQSSSGGLRIQSCKFMGGAFGYYMRLENGANTSDLFIIGCSIEWMSRACVLLMNQGEGHFYNAMISACEFSPSYVGGYGILAITTTGEWWLSGVTINGCTTVLNGGAIGVDLSGVAWAQVVGNTFNGPATSWGVVFRPSSTGCSQSSNSYAGVIPTSNQQQP
jgi:hypothetical protein